MEETSHHKRTDHQDRLSAEREAEIRESLDGYLGCDVSDCDSCVRHLLLGEIDALRAEQTGSDALGGLVEDARTAFLHGSMTDWGRTLTALFSGLDAYHEARGTAPARPAEAAEAST